MSVAKSAYPLALSVRRDLHRHPELSTKEFRSAKLVFDNLKSLGLKPSLCCNKTGVVASVDNGKGKTVVIRADLDALPLQEETGLAFTSTIPGVMHACGHDMHTGILVGAAQALIACKDTWKGRAVLLFQPSEEMAPGGAVSMIKEKAFPLGADAVFGLHVSTDHPCGTVGLKSGPDYAGVVDFEVVVNVNGGHGASPQTTADPIVCCCAMISQMQTLVSRESPPHEPSVVTVGTFHSGTKQNIIPTEAKFSGTIRALSGAHLDFLRTRLGEIVTAIAASHKAKALVRFEKAYPPGYNDPHLIEKAEIALKSTLGAKKVIMRDAPVMHAEDFAYYQKKTPGIYVHLGVRPLQTKSVPGIHTPYFAPCERAILTGIAVHVSLAIDILSS